MEQKSGLIDGAVMVCDGTGAAANLTSAHFGAWEDIFGIILGINADRSHP
jgi:hypothetical protein